MKTVNQGDELTRQKDGEQYRVIRIVNGVILMKASDPRKQALLVTGTDCLSEFITKPRTAHGPHGPAFLAT